MTDGAVIITGGANRIGRAIAESFASDGWEVVIHYNTSKKAANTAVAAITASGGTAVALNADFTIEEEAISLIDRAQSALNRPITCLVNNASTFVHDVIATVSAETWNCHLAVNLKAPLLLIQEFSRILPADYEGDIVNILDQRVWNPTSEFLTYTISKSALWTLTRATALGLAPRIRVNGVGPGPVLPSKRQSEEHFSAQAAATPLGRSVPIADVVAAVKFLVSVKSVTGQMIAVDSGQHLFTSPRTQQE